MKLTAHRKSLGFYLLKLIVYPLACIPLSILFYLGWSLAAVVYHLNTPRRKRILSNLAIANKLSLSNQQRKKLAMSSLRNQYVAFFEFFALKKIRKNTNDFIWCANLQVIKEIREQHNCPVIIVGCQQASWDVAFVNSMQQIPCALVGDGFENAILQQWNLDQRGLSEEHYLHSKNAVFKGLKLLQQNICVGITLDNAWLSSQYAYPFMGATAYTSVTPALWAYKLACPLVVMDLRRDGGRYISHFSAPLWPDTQRAMDDEVPRLMDRLCEQFEASMLAHPGQYVWHHHRWQQHHRLQLKKRFRHDFILLVLPNDLILCQMLYPYLVEAMDEIYPRANISLLCPPFLEAQSEYETHIYYADEELLINDYRYQMVINLTSDIRVNRHFSKLAAFEVVDCFTGYKYVKYVSKILKQQLMESI